jgi:hypothetical protein
MESFDQMLEMLFSDSNPGGKLLLSLAIGIPTFLLHEHVKSKMFKIALLRDPEFQEDNPFTRVLLKNTEVWIDPKWRKLKYGHTFLEFFSITLFLFGLYFAFECTIIIGGTIVFSILGWT